MPQATPEMIRDAARWNALVNCGGLSCMGWAGFNPKTWTDGIDVGHRHVTINFFTHHGGVFPLRADTHNESLRLLTEFADVVSADLDTNIPSYGSILPEVDYKDAFHKLVSAMRERKLAAVGKPDPESRAVYHALQHLLVKYGDRGALAGPLFQPIERTHAEPG